MHRLTAVLAAGLKKLGLAIVNDTFFDTLTLATGERTSAIHEAAVARDANLRRIDGEHLGISLDETSTREERESPVVDLRAGGCRAARLRGHRGQRVEEGFAPELARTSAFLTHPTFNRYHSETEMMRYLRRLADKDIALDRAMIPLGSCTMKLNAASEMFPVTWREFGQVHPFAPANQSVGYREMIGELEAMLCAATGYAAVSLQPNAGSQGEYAGLLIIRAYHASRGEATATCA